MEDSRKVSKQEFKKLSFRKKKITVKIPKFTNVLIITTLSNATDGTFNISTKTYDSKQIDKFLGGEK